jgi:hypothetical protein
LALGTATSGTGTSASKEDHVHPTTGVALLAGSTFTGLITGKTNTGGSVASSNDTGSMSVRGNSTNAAAMSFHLPGLYAMNMGLDTDNAFKIGGWSMGAIRFTLDGSGNLSITGNLVYNISTTTSGTSYSLVLSDAGKIVEMSGGGTLTVPTNATVAFPIGTQINILQTGASQVTVGGAGVTINATPGLKLRAQWSSATLIKRGTDTWVLVGDISA